MLGNLIQGNIFMKMMKDIIPGHFHGWQMVFL
jgi:hypothetical protein